MHGTSTHSGFTRLGEDDLDRGMLPPKLQPSLWLPAPAQGPSRADRAKSIRIKHSHRNGTGGSERLEEA
jgi:hypothetical protein